MVDEGDAEQDDDVYRLLGQMIAAISNLEHALDLAILSIDDHHPDWLQQASPKPPMKVRPKVEIIVRFVVEDGLGYGPALPDDFASLVANVFDLRNVLLHGRVRGWEEPVENGESAIYVTRLVVERRDGKPLIGLSTAVVNFSAIRDLISRAGHFAQMIKDAVPLPRRHDVEMEVLLETFRARRDASSDDEQVSI